MSLALRRTISVPDEIIGGVVDSIRTAIPGNVPGATTIVTGDLGIVLRVLGH